MSPAKIPNVDQLLPHIGQMVMLHNIRHFDDRRLVAEFDLARENPFKTDAGTTPGYVAIEMMVQAVSALAGIDGYHRGEAPKVGLLLGARGCKIHCAQMPESGLLVVEVSEVMLSDGIAVFDGTVKLDSDMLAEGQIKAIQPEDTNQFLVEQGLI